VLKIGLHFLIIELATNETLGIEHTVIKDNESSMREKIKITNSRVARVHGDLVLSGVTDETLAFGERDIGGCRAVTLIVGNDFNTVVLPDTDTSVGPQSKISPNG
jgi:hypothetical protein